MQAPLSRFILCLGIELLLLWLVWHSLSVVRLPSRSTSPSARKRQVHPHSPKECPVCRAGHKKCKAPSSATAEAWQKHASGRGRPKTVVTDGYACNNSECLYFNVTDGHLHALVGNGNHQGADTIQYFKCQACGTKVSAR